MIRAYDCVWRHGARGEGVEGKRKTRGSKDARQRLEHIRDSRRIDCLARMHSYLCHDYLRHGVALAGTDFWAAAGAIATAFAVFVDLAVGILSPLLERSRMKSEALLRGASLAFTLKGPAASLKSISGLLERPIEGFGLDHCEALIAAHQRSAMPSLSPADLHALSLLLGKRKTLALATALGIIESLRPTIGRSIEETEDIGRLLQPFHGADFGS